MLLPGRQGRERHISNVCKYEKNISCPRSICDVKVSLANQKDHFLECFEDNNYIKYLQDDTLKLNLNKFIKGRHREYVLLLESENDKDSLFLRIHQSRRELVILNVNRYVKYSVSCKISTGKTSRSFEGMPVPLGTLEDSDFYRNNCLKVPDFLIEQLGGQEQQTFHVDLKIESWEIPQFSLHLTM